MVIKKRLLPLILLLAPFFVDAQNFGGNPASVHWQQINTKTARVIFPFGLDSQASRISNIVALLDSTTANTIGGRQRKWNIVLLNQTTIPNAYVRLAPVISELNLLPGQDNFTNGSIRWDDNLIIHENRHMQQLANFNHGLTKAFSFFLGQEGQLLANGLTIPDYFFEGDAVWQETLVSAQGRGRMPSFYNGLRSLVISNKKYSWMKLRSGSLKDYTPDHYELGYQLVAYGNQQYGTNFWQKVTTDAVNFKGLLYPFNKAVAKYSGTSYQQFRQGALHYFKQQTLADSTAYDSLLYLTPIIKNTVASYRYPVYVNKDTVIISKQSYQKNKGFYWLVQGREELIQLKKPVTDDNFSYANGKVTYTSYQTGPRWANRDYSNIQLLDVYTKKQHQLTFKSKYFSPALSKDAANIIAVAVAPDGSSSLHIINANNGAIIKKLPNSEQYFYTQTKYINSSTVVSAVRNPQGQMALVTINLADGSATTLTPFSFNVVGYPCVKNDTVYYSAMDNSTPTDKIFAVTLKDKKLYRLTNTANGIYQPAAAVDGSILVSAFTADGYRLATIPSAGLHWQVVNVAAYTKNNTIGTAAALGSNGAGALYQLAGNSNAVVAYPKWYNLFNYHSWRPVVNEPEYGYELYSDNILTSLSSVLSYNYNRNEHSHIFGFSGTYAGWFPFLNMGAEARLHRVVDTALGKAVEFNSAKVYTGLYVPLGFVGGITSKYLTVGSTYNIEQLYYNGIGKNITANKAIHYANTFLAFSNIGQQARQNINPAFAQTFSFSYRNAFDYRKNHKMVLAASVYLPGLFTNHSLVLTGALQKRDSFPDLFSNNFSYSRGYDALSQPDMYKFGVNYHLPLWYPDWGFGNMVFFQRIRANAFYDYTTVSARRRNGSNAWLLNRSAGGELYFDTKLWNALQASFGIRFSHLVDVNYRNPTVKNRWEIILPINLIPD